MSRNHKEPDRLTQDTAAALAAGMSYGKWKAMQNPAETKKPPLPDGWCTCAWCGKPFKPKTKRVQYYCEAYCQIEAQKERNRKKKEEKNAMQGTFDVLKGEITNV